MKDVLLDLARRQPDPMRRRSVVREYLQDRILRALQTGGAFTDWCFLGGTALRFLFGLPRYSEDLDFSLLRPGDARFHRAMGTVRDELAAQAYQVHVTEKAERAVASASIQFAGILFEAGAAAHRGEVLSVKVEVDTNPPAGAVAQTRVVRRFAMLNVLHHDQASLFAGKLHAVLTRPYTKGRDLFDLVWYLSDVAWPEPNLVLLNNALTQSRWRGPPLSTRNWRRQVARRLTTVDWRRAKADVTPFLEQSADVELVSRAVLARLLSPRRRSR